VIDAIELDPDDIDESGEPGPSWFECTMLPRGDMLAVIQRNKDLDGRSVNLFTNALERKPRSDLLDYYLVPHLYHPGSHYIYTTPDPSRFRYKNWRPEVTAIAIDHQTIAPCGLFSNTLSWIDGVDRSPSERTYNAGFAVYTIESDSDPLDKQLAVIYSGRLKRIDAELRRFRDYRGYEVVYSGGKSLHFHFCFDLRHLKRDLAVSGNSSYRDHWFQDLPDNLLRPAYAVSWDSLAAIFGEITEIKADRGLRSWEQLRRCPWALRLVSGGHPLRLPPGHLIPQPVLASAIFKNAKRSATEWFHDPDKLGQVCREERVRRRKPFIEQDFSVTSREIELFEQHAPAIFDQIIRGEYPKFARSEVTDTGFRCYFFNGPGDINPASYCDGNRNRIRLQGRHNVNSDGLTLAATPNQIFDWIVSQDRGADDAAPDDWIMRRYKAAVHDRRTLAQFLDEHVVEMIAPPSHSTIPTWMQKLGVGNGPNSHVLIRGPQGCGKSTKTMAKIPTLHENDPGVIFFSSPSIQQAEEKIETFKRVNKDERFIPFLYLSLTALYERFCPPSDRLSHLDILAEGGSSWLYAVHERQPEVYEAMWAYRCRLFDLIADDKIPVLFGTHETMRQHADEGMTRVFYAQDFGPRWFETMPLQEREDWRNRLLGQNCFHRVIVDEVTAHDLVSIHPAQIVEWVQQCSSEIGYGAIRDIAERYWKFKDYLSQHPCKDMTWNLFLEIINCEYTIDHMVEVSGREVPFDDRDGIYGKMVGQRYYIRSREWWNKFWRVTMLTTEAVPTRIIQALNREAINRGEEQDDRIKVYEFGLPDSARDTITIELQRTCRKETLLQLVRAYREQYPQAEFISDMVKTRISEFAVTTHISAKGSNAYIGLDIISFYNALSPALFGELGALNTRFGRSDLVRLFYTDRFDQTCGRNRGFRGEECRDHRAVFPPRLYNWLAPAISEASYVGVMVKTTVDLNTETDESIESDETEDSLVIVGYPALLRNAGIAPSEGLQ
jgi:hypothetical protein